MGHYSRVILQLKRPNTPVDCSTQRQMLTGNVASAVPAYLYTLVYLSVRFLWKVGRGSISLYPLLANYVCFVLWAPRYGVKLDPGLVLTVLYPSHCVFTEPKRLIVTRLWCSVWRQCM
jgi:hypothetical protein